MYKEEIAQMTGLCLEEITGYYEVSKDLATLKSFLDEMVTKRGIPIFLNQVLITGKVKVNFGGYDGTASEAAFSLERAVIAIFDYRAVIVSGLNKDFSQRDRAILCPSNYGFKEDHFRPTEIVNNADCEEYAAKISFVTEKNYLTIRIYPAAEIYTIRTKKGRK